MNAAVLLIPFLLIRFGLLALLDRAALKRAARFAPMWGKERGAYLVYQLSNLAIFLYLLFLQIQAGQPGLFCAGLIVYLLGLGLCAAAQLAFAAPDEAGLNTKGVYRFSRNPMYAAYFLCFVGMALLTRSVLLLGLVVIFQISAHWIILAEERWCLDQFGEKYARYMSEVNRYFLRKIR